MVLKVYGHPWSAATRRVLVVLKEKEVEYEIVKVNLMEGAHKKPEYKEVQPFGQIPYIVEDDGFTLYESRAICWYIATKYANQGTKLLPDPSDPKATALFEQAASIEFSNFEPMCDAIVAERLTKARKGTPANEEFLKMYVEKLGRKLDAYDIILSKQKYLAGDEITIADLFHLPYGAAMKFCKVDFMENESRPHLVRWWKDISTRPSWQSLKIELPKIMTVGGGILAKPLMKTFKLVQHMKSTSK